MSTLAIDSVQFYRDNGSVNSVPRYVKQEKTIEVFSAKNEDEVYAQAGEEAAIRQEKIAKKIYEDAEGKIANRSMAATLCAGSTVAFAAAAGAAAFTTAPLWVPIALAGAAAASLGGAIVGLFKTREASNEKAAALNFRRDAQTTLKSADKTEYVEKTYAEMFVRSGLCGGDNSNVSISDELVAKTAAELFPNEGVFTQFLLLEPDINKNNASYAKLVEVVVDSRIYNNVQDRRGRRKGLQKNEYVVEPEYYNFLKLYTNEGKMSAGEAERLVDIAQALKTKHTYHGEGEDAMFFDLNNDGVINDADFNLFSSCVRSKAPVEWTSNSDTYPRMYIYDYNKDGKVDDADRQIYEGCLGSPRLDINQDGVVNSKDARLLLSYVEANRKKEIVRGEEYFSVKKINGGD